MLTTIRMPTRAPYSDIHRGLRVVHWKYGRGEVAALNRPARQAGVTFDDDTKLVLDPPPRTVWLKDLTPEPVDMPPVMAREPAPYFRLVWPLDATAGEGEV